MSTNYENAYEGLPVHYECLLASQDVSEAVMAIPEINVAADNVIVGKFRSGEAVIQLRDPNGDYNIAKAPNFFTRNSQQQNGVGTPILFKAGYSQMPQLVFSGSVHNVEYHSDRGIVEITVLDKSALLLKEVVNVGLEKRFRIAPETEQQVANALGEGQHRENGVYPILKALLPTSKESQTLHISLTETGTYKESLKTQGNLDNRNFTIDEDGVETEGSLLGLSSDQLSTFPQLQAKSPIRHDGAVSMVKAILDAFSISPSSALFYPVNVGEHFDVVNRIGYETLGATGAEYDVLGSFQGFPTDRIKVDNDFYTLYTTGNDDTHHKSRILKWDGNDYEETILYSFPVGVAAWQITAKADASEIYVMTRNNVAAVSDLDYDSLVARSDSTVRIEKLTLNSDGDVTGSSVIANRGSTYRPQLACYYHVTGAYGMLPDSRTGFEIYNNAYLVYRYTRGTDKFGICAYNLSSGTVTSLLEATTDGEQNHAGTGFAIHGDTLVAVFTWRDGTNSEKKVYSYDLSSLP